MKSARHLFEFYRHGFSTVCQMVKAIIPPDFVFIALAINSILLLSTNLKTIPFIYLPSVQ